MWAYLILTIGSLVFWSLYQMAPSGLQLFAVNNVDLKVWGVKIAPQWIQNINTVVHRGRRAAAGGALRPAARAWLEDRHSAAVRRVAAPDGRSAFSRCRSASSSPTPTGMSAFVVAVRELRAAEHR